MVNQRLSMRYRLALSCFFLGILTVFMVWSFQWALESQRVITFDMPGDITALVMHEVPRSTMADVAIAQAELKKYIYDQSLSLIISSDGDGRPEMLVYDPHGLLSWFPSTSTNSLHPARSGLYLFRGTYSERRWSEAGRTPLLPKGVVPEGIIAPPSGVGSRQYARRITQEPLPAGKYTINTIDTTQVRHILDLLQRMGLAEQQRQTIPFVVYLMLDPQFGIMMLFLAMGHICALLYWALYLRGRTPEFSIRSRYGARPRDLAWENTVGGWPGLLAGSVLGVIFAGLLVAAMGQVPLTPYIFRILAYAAVIAAVVSIVTWSTLLYIVISLGYEVNLNA